MGCIQSAPEAAYVQQPIGQQQQQQQQQWPQQQQQQQQQQQPRPYGVCDVIFLFLQYLNSAQSTIDICVFTITCDEISNVVMALHRRGVKVRVITDDDQEVSLGSDIKKLREAGIPVKLDHAKTNMHHKFCIIDRKLLLNGSFNWTRQAVIGNQENVVILDTPHLIGEFGRQFEMLWASFRA